MRPPEETLVACVWMPRFEIQVERWRHPELAEVPLALFTAGSQPILAGCSQEAEMEGLKPGMPMREAMATAPQALFCEADPAFYADILLRIAAELESISPLVEPAPPGSVFLCLEGLVATDNAGRGGVYRTRRDLVAGLERSIKPAWTTHIGIGRGKYIAQAASRCPLSDPQHSLSDQYPTRNALAFSASGKTGWVLHDRAAAFLEPLPVDRLPISAEMKRKLFLFGIHTLGQLSQLPMGSVMAQFGLEGRRAWLLSRGLDGEPLRPRQTPVEIVETVQFADPEAALAALLAAVQQLLETALKRPERKGRGVRQVRIDALLEGGHTWSLVITPKQPGTRPETLFPPIRYKLEREHPTEAVEAVTLALTAFVSALGGQGTLFVEPREVRRQRLVEAVQQLRTQMESVPLSRVMEVEPWSRIPERRHQLIRYDP